MTTTIPAIDYTDKDFGSLRAAMIRLAEQRLPEWTDRSPSDLGMLLIDLFAYAADVCLYYQDRIASELFPGLATEARSIVDLLRLIGYERFPSAPAMADLTLTFAAPAGLLVVTVPHGAQFASQPRDGMPVLFSYLGPDLDLDLTSDQVRPGIDIDGNPIVHYDRLPVEQSLGIGPVVIGSSRGESNQTFPLPDPGVIVDSVVVEVDEGAGFVQWQRRDSLLFDIAPDGRALLSLPDARNYQVLVDWRGTAHVVFGDDRRPPAAANNIRARYRVTQGAIGNVGKGTITAAVTPLPSLRSVTNPLGAAGGSDTESVEHAVRHAPMAYRAMNRAVTAADYVALAHQTGAVAKARARAQAWNQIDLFVAPTGDVCQPLPEALRQRLLGYFEDKRMAGTLVRVLDARCVAVDVTLEVLVDQRFEVDAVTSRVEAAVAGLLDFQTVDFGKTVFQSDVYAAAEAVAGVLAVTVTRFRRHDQPAPDLDAELARHHLPPLAELPLFLRQAISVDVAAEGRIEIEAFEIPMLGDLIVRTRTGTP